MLVTIKARVMSSVCPVLCCESEIFRLFDSRLCLIFVSLFTAAHFFLKF